MQSLNRYLKLITVFLFFNVVFAAYRFFPLNSNSGLFSVLVPLLELVIIFILLLPGKLYNFRFFISLVLNSVLLFYTLGEIFYRYFYMEHFSMITDIRLLPGLFTMLFSGLKLKSVYVNLFSVMFSLAAVFSVSTLLLFPAASFLRKYMPRFGKRAFFLLLLFLSALNVISPDFSPFVSIRDSVYAFYRFETAPASGNRFMINSAVETNKNFLKVPDNKFHAAADNTENPAYLRNINDLPQETEEFFSEELLSGNLQPSFYFPGIRDSDIHFAVVESYGAVLFQRPEYKEHILNLYKNLSPLLKNEGWEVKSGYVNSPAFGGRSWLADASLLAADQIDSQQLFDERIKTGETAYFLKLMENAGYHRYYIAPGTTKTSAEWKKAYPFDTYLIRPDFGYKGPNIAFGTMTDQFALERFSSRYLSESKKEFCFYLLVSSHTPFVRIPEFKPDWNFSMDGMEYKNGYLKIFDNNWLTGNELAEGYLEGISYSLETTVRYLTEKLSGEEFMVIIGDHQPRKPVSGPDPGFPVLFHIIYPSDFRISFPENWDLNSGLVPNPLPQNYNDIPDMGELPFLVESVLRYKHNSFSLVNE